MEEDNASDINKFIGSSEPDDREEVTVTVKDRTFRAKIVLRGNVLSVTALEEAHVPLIFVIERVTFKRDQVTLVKEKCHESIQNEPSVLLQFSCEEDNFSITFDDEKLVEQWMVKLATCSHAISHAQLDEVAYKFFTMGTPTEGASETSDSSNFHNFFLANPTTATHVFAISQPNGLPSRRITFEETMWESKLSLLLPMELIKLYKKWNNEFCCLLESKQHSWPPSSLSLLHEILRELRETAETYEQCQEFLSTYSGPPFRKSVEKRRVAFGAVPTNLHLQTFGISGEPSKELITCGTASAGPYGFANGGLTRLQNALNVDNALMSVPFFSKRNILQDQKRSIGELSRKIDVEWKMSSFGKPDKVCLEISTGIKQVYEKLKDTLIRIPDIDKLIDQLVEEHKKRFCNGSSSKKTETVILVDSLQNQLDNLEAMLISLNTKIAVIDSLDDEQRSVYEKSAREAMSACLDDLLQLTNSVLEAQLFGLVTSLSKTSIIHQYIHIQTRSDFVFSQAVTIAATAALSRVTNWITNTDNEFLLVVFSFLSAYADEKGMIEDAYEAWKLVESKAEFKFVRAPSSVCRNCIPVLAGTRAGVKVSLPLPHDKYDDLPESLKKCDSFRIRTAYFNLGVNHEATFAQSFGGVVFETAINQEAAQKIATFLARTNCQTEAADAVVELVDAVATEGSRKNLNIFERAMTACELLGGKAAVGCKSGKDRTSMAVTLEQGRLLRETCGLGPIQVSEVINSLRKDGVRRENCRKNVGKPLYSFSPFQMHFLPKPFRPPMGTYRQGVAS